MTVAVCGGSGFIGTHLIKKLIQKSYTVVCIDIVPPRFTDEKLFYIYTDLSKSPVPYHTFDSVDVVINLSGKTILGKWTPAYKKEIRDSRIETTRMIVDSIAEAAQKPTIFINASAIGFYGETGDAEVTEQTPLGETYLADVVYDWELEAKRAQAYGVRVVCIRTAPVLGDGGFLATLRAYGRLGFFMKLSQKKFWMSWIHIDDLIQCYLFAIETQTLQGVVNASSPEPLFHYDFMKEISRIFKKPLIGTVPQTLLRWKYGDLFDELVRSQRVFPKRLLDKGFLFQYSKLEEALTAIKTNEKNR